MPSVLASFLDHLANRQSFQTVCFLKRLQPGNRRAYLVGIVRLKRNQLGHGPMMFGDDESFSRLDAP